MGTGVVATANAVIEAGQTFSRADCDLISRAKEGDGDAFATLFDLHKRTVYLQCFRMTRDVAGAEDLTQDVFIQVFRKLATFREDALFSTWLYRVTVNTVLMEFRKKHPRQVSLDEPVQMDSSCEPRDIGRLDLELEGSVDRIALGRAIRELSAGSRRIFLLFTVHGYEHAEIAKLLHCSVGTSKSQLHKARLKMQAVLFQKHEIVCKKFQAKKIKAARTLRSAVAA
jgi:RNA polymerase sigma-70 factor (ECF subfamily)